MKKKIIIVDDKEVFRNSLVETLKTAGDVEIISQASNGEEFLEQVAAQQPDIVFMDIEMPIMNGIEATKKAMKKYPSLVIIGLSLYNNKVYVEKLIEVGARGYLLKSCDNIELFKIIIENPQAEVFYSEDISQKSDINKNKVRNILLVDDFNTNVVVMRNTLIMAGFNVEGFTNPQEALNSIKDEKNKYDLFVVDYRMPIMNGAELVKEIRRIFRYKKTPIIVLSSETDRQKKIEAKKAGATGWLKKPLKLDVFKKIIETSL